MHKVLEDATRDMNGRVSRTEPMVEESVNHSAYGERERIAAPASQANHFELVRVIERMYRRYLDRLRVDLIRIGADDISLPPMPCCFSPSVTTTCPCGI